MLTKNANKYQVDITQFSKISNGANIQFKIFGVKNPISDTNSLSYELIINDKNSHKIESKSINAGLNAAKTFSISTLVIDEIT